MQRLLWFLREDRKPWIVSVQTEIRDHVEDTLFHHKLNGLSWNLRYPFVLKINFVVFLAYKVVGGIPPSCFPTSFINDISWPPFCWAPTTVTLPWNTMALPLQTLLAGGFYFIYISFEIPPSWTHFPPKQSGQHIIPFYLAIQVRLFVHLLIIYRLRCH